MDITYGSVEGTAPEGYLSRRVHFSTLARLNEPTKEGMLSRTILGSGFGTRELPLSIGFMDQTAHSDMATADIVGRLDAVKIDGNNVEGWGWLADTPRGRDAFQAVNLAFIRGNSIDMAEVKYTVDVDWDEENDDLSIKVVFTESKVGATTICAIPAFASANAKLEAESLTAALAVEGDLEVGGEWYVEVPEGPTDLTAAGAIVLDHDAFTVPEPEHYQTIALSADGRTLTGHLGTWDGCHAGFMDRCVRIPRSRTNYASYCKSLGHTDKGKVYTGPVLLLGGHEATREAINKAMEDVSNTWADVVVIDGQFGPWMCGMVRPGVTDEALAAARGSRVSGHWVRGELYAIACVSTEGFDVPRVTQYAVELDADNEVEYLAASMTLDCGCDDEPTLEDRVKNLEHVLGIHTELLEEDDVLLPYSARAAAMLSLGDDDDSEEG